MIRDGRFWSMMIGSNIFAIPFHMWMFVMVGFSMDSGRAAGLEVIPIFLFMSTILLAVPLLIIQGILRLFMDRKFNSEEKIKRIINDMKGIGIVILAQGLLGAMIHMVALG